MTELNILPKTKATNWRELPTWLKYYMPCLGIIILLIGVYMNSELIKNVSEFMLFLMGGLIYLHYTHETRNKTLKKSLILGLISFIVISLILIYIRTSS